MYTADSKIDRVREHISDRCMHNAWNGPKELGRNDEKCALRSYGVHQAPRAAVLCCGTTYPRDLLRTSLSNGMAWADDHVTVNGWEVLPKYLEI